ncbi:MAG: molybdopterin molybdotransferase MoeA [Planctomycetota bacterium]|nr:molybdopterin molybdotransferase MoeA [Planctomycetota bacterium]
MMTWQEAFRLVLDHALPLGPEIGPVCSSSEGAILAETILADVDAPPFDKALMDGFALAGDTPAFPEGWPLEQGVFAGDAVPDLLCLGHACPVATGAKIPNGADRVVPFERTGKKNGFLQVADVPKPESFLARIGADYRAGELLLKRGTVLGPATTGALAAAGKTAVKLIPVPIVGVISTGSELVEPNVKPMGSHIRNSNGPMLLSAIHRAGCLPKYLGIAPDCKDTLKNLILEGLTQTVLILSGGVSVGEKDFVRPMLESLGVKILVHGIKLKPGRPFLFGVNPLGGLVFGLPGNPTSALANFDLLIHPALMAMRGYTNPGPHFQTGIMGESLSVDNNRPTLRPVAVKMDAGAIIVTDLGAKGSFELGVLTRAQGWLELPPGQFSIQKGSEVRILLPDISATMARLHQNA